MNSAGSSALGAYGWRVAGVGDAAQRYLLEAPSNWPLLTIDRVYGAPTMSRSVTTGMVFIDDQCSEYESADQNGKVGCVRIDRNPLTARLTSATGFSDEVIVHPELSSVASIAGHWLGRTVFHAGAFLTGTGAWAVLGAREAGKSTLLASLANKGVGIVTDDVMVVHADQVYAGPRCVDLREGAAQWLGQGEEIGTSGPRHRWRVRVDPIPAVVSLRGWILPEWNDLIRVEPVPVASRLPILCDNLAIKRPPADPEHLLDLSLLPILRFQRPRRWEVMDSAAAALLDTLSR